jgi:hypothetical protein
VSLAGLVGCAMVLWHLKVLMSVCLKILVTFLICGMHVCMSFIFHKSFTRYRNSHITNNKKHSNIE